MKTTNWSRTHDKLVVVDRQQDSKNNNSPTEWGQKIAEGLDDIDDRWAKLNTYAEPKIWEKHDRYGDTYFQVYDPQGDRYLFFHSKDEARCWSDQRYYIEET